MLQNGLYNLIGAVIRLGIGIISVPLLIQFLGAEKYGLYTILLAIINLAALSEWSISMILTVFLTNANANENKKTIVIVSITIIFILITFTSGALYAAIPYIKNAFLDLTDVSKELLVTGCYLSIIIVAARLFLQFFVGIEQANNKYKLLNKINTAYHIIQTGATIIIAWLYASIYSILIIQIIISLFFVFVHMFLCYKAKLLDGLKKGDKVHWSEFVPIMKYGIKTYLGVIGSALFSQGDRLLVGRLLGVEIAGIYAAVKGIVVQINSLSSMPVQPLVTVVSTIYNEHSLKISIKKFILPIKKAIILNSVMAIGVGSCLLLLSPELCQWLLKTTKYRGGDLLMSLQLIILIYTIYSLNAVGYYILFAIKKEGINTLATLLCGSLSLILIAILGQMYGFLGIVAGNAVYILTLFLNIYAFRMLGLSIRYFFNDIRFLLIIFFVLAVVSALTSDIIIRVVLALAIAIGLIKTVYPYFENYLVFAREKIKNTLVK